MQPQNTFNTLPADTSNERNSKLVENLSMALFIASFVSPAVFAMLITVISSPSGRQLGLLQFIVMGIYNLPAAIVGLIGLSVGKALSYKTRKGSIGLYILSIVASVIGIGVQASWFLSTFFS